VALESHSPASTQPPFEVRVRLLHWMQGFVRLPLQSKILYHATGLQEGNFCSALQFVELSVCLTAVTRANIPAGYPCAGTSGSVVWPMHMPFASVVFGLFLNLKLLKVVSHVLLTSLIHQFLVTDFSDSSKCARSCMLWSKLRSWSSWVVENQCWRLSKPNWTSNLM